ncbi:GNAT family N-acetyltransferase [Pseudoalteromonas luteoviolacea]|nr:GNAT family N-acetyltransferase [Pseudoalteromonas luteoviolacea]MBQ4878596.1 tRNA(Met) cytidine acetyltransferase [Pseudoalteromonas luteoviolacea]MBQ4907751.1 tRNA(Met) cytidine acetyltransferase [Pseudoalteromonas luteoviolacea]
MTTSVLSGWSQLMQDCKPFNLDSLLLALQNARHRQLLLLCGSRSWGQAYFQRLAHSTEQLILSDDSTLGKAVWPQHLHQILGQEFDFVLYDGYSGIVPNKLAACTGTVRSGGLLVLLLPELSNLVSWCDPALTRWLSEGEQATLSPFLKRFAHQVQQQNCWIINESGEANLPAQYCAEKSTLDLQSQAHLVALITAHFQRESNTPILLSADRGRGKSATLGLIAAAFADKQVILCAQQRRAVQNGFKHYAQALHLDEPKVNQNHCQTLSYMPPDIVIATKPQCDILLIDEAAAIPVPILKQLLDLYPNTVFASTLVGYEGNGRGYTLRFKAHLEAEHPHFLDLHLQEPIRYGAGDPLEQHMRQLLALDSQYSAIEPAQSTLEYSEVSRDTLIHNEALLQQIFALLVLAHYQTSVNDLRQLLDSPSNRLFVVSQHHQPVAVCLVGLEGNLTSELASKIALGERRPAGHLMAQQLTQLLGNTQFCTAQGARIVRIAVAPSHQKLGIGSKLIRFVMAQLNSQVSYFGSSFGAQSQLLNFWQQLGFKPMKLGFKQDKASGEFAVLVVHDNSKIALSAEQDAFTEQLFFALSNLYAKLPWTLVRSLLSTLPDRGLPEQLFKQVAYLASKTATEQQIAPAIQQVIKTQPSIINSLSRIAQQQVIQLLLQRHQPKELAKALKLESKKQLQLAYQSLLSEVYAEITRKNGTY